MLSQLVLGLCLSIPSHAYAALSEFHAASSVAHAPSDLSAVGAPAHASSPVIWSPGTEGLHNRLAEGAKAEAAAKSAKAKAKPKSEAEAKVEMKDKPKPEAIARIHDNLLNDFDPKIKRPPIPVHAISEGGMTLRLNARKLGANDFRAPTPLEAKDPQAPTSLEAPGINKMTRYTSDELRHIEHKAKQLKMGFDYTYMGDGVFVRNEKEMWDVHGYGGQIRVYDHGDDHELLYETDCCYCGGQRRSGADLTTGESLITAGISVCSFVTCTAGYVALKIATERM